MRTLRLTLSYTDDAMHPMHRFLVESDAVERERLLHGNTTTELNTFLFYVEGDRGAYADALGEVEAVETYAIEPIDEGSFYAYIRQTPTETNETLYRALSRPSLLVVPPVEFSPDGTVQLTVLGAPDRLRAMLDDLPAGVSADIERVADSDVSLGGEDLLTARQAEALQVALELGYYEVPREAAVTDIADRLDCAPSTASNHLRKAEAALVRRHLGRA